LWWPGVAAKLMCTVRGQLSQVQYEREERRVLRCLWKMASARGLPWNKHVTILLGHPEILTIVADDWVVWRVCHVPAHCKNSCSDQGRVWHEDSQWVPISATDLMQPSPNYFGHLVLLLCCRRMTSVVHLMRAHASSASTSSTLTRYLSTITWMRRTTNCVVPLRNWVQSISGFPSTGSTRSY